MQHDSNKNDSKQKDKRLFGEICKECSEKIKRCHLE